MEPVLYEITCLPRNASHHKQEEVIHVPPKKFGVDGADVVVVRIWDFSHVLVEHREGHAQPLRIDIGRRKISFRMQIWDRHLSCRLIADNRWNCQITQWYGRWLAFSSEILFRAGFL